LAAVRLGLVEAVPLTYELPWFHGWNDRGQYFADILEACRKTTSEFRSAFGDFAVSRLDAPSGTNEHARAVGVLANLGDVRLVAHLEQRFKESGVLYGYENHALIALGTAGAANLFLQSARAVGDRIMLISINDGGFERGRVGKSVAHLTGDYAFLVGAEFEKCSERRGERATPGGRKVSHPIHRLVGLSPIPLLH
jgi:hypothetical protein